LKQWLPTRFSREHLNNFKGTATIRVGKERTVEVSLRYYGSKKKSCMSVVGNYSIENIICKLMMFANLR